MHRGGHGMRILPFFFWRWPPEFRRDARDGSTFPWKFPPMPAYKIPQKYPSASQERQLMVDKVMVPITRGYITSGHVLSLSGFFSLPKGPTDIRLVYDMTKCGLNRCLWAPRFYLPVLDSLFDSIDYESYMSDIDQGEMFLNYFCDPELPPYMGVDVTEAVCGSAFDTSQRRIWMRWNRWAMGVRQSPYATTRMYAISLEIIKGNRRDPTNPFAWASIRLNLPSSPDYDPSAPWVSKRTTSGQLPSDCFVFVDDGRVLDRTRGGCNRATRRVGSVMNHLGEQDASRKRRGCSQRSGAWIGALFRADQNSIGIVTSQDKWDKARKIIAKWINVVSFGAVVDRKELERDRGFLVHLSMLYPSFTPYLKGFHLSLESWRPDRDKDGWKLPVNDWIRLKQHLQDKGELSFDFPIDHTQAPTSITVAPRLVDDLKALEHLLSDSTPPMRVVRSRKLSSIAMSFADASGKGAGASTLTDNSKLSILHNVYKVDRKTSSNFKELHNLVDTIEQEYEAGNFHNKEAFLCTDNSVAERAFYKGNSKSPLLFDLVLRLCKLQLKANFKLHVVHVAGTRMVEQGTDSLSRGMIYEGLLGARFNFLHYLPLNKTAIERLPKVLEWIKTWAPLQHSVLSPEDWFEKGHDIVDWTKSEENLWRPVIQSSCWIWDPPPAAAYKAAEQTRIARHKRQSSVHIFICSRLLTSMWRAQLHKSADIVLEIPPSTVFWKKEMHEPLVIALYFPMFQHQPWICKGTKFLVSFRASVKAEFINQNSASRHFSSVLKTASSFNNLSAERVQSILSSEFRLS